MDTEVAQVLSDRLRYFGFELMKELWSSNSAAHVTIIADWELEGLDEAEIARKMKRKRLKRVLVKLKKIAIFPVGEHLIACYQVDVLVGTNLFREQGAHKRNWSSYLVCFLAQEEKQDLQ